MDLARIEDKARSDLERLLGAATIEVRTPPRTRRKGAGFDRRDTVWIGLLGEPARELVIHRTSFIWPWEMGLLESYHRAMMPLAEVPEDYAEAAMADLMLSVVARQHFQANWSVGEAVLRLLREAAASTYEGQRLSVNFLVDLAMDPSGSDRMWLSEYAEAAWWSQLGSGTTTACLVNRVGQVEGLIDLEVATDGLDLPEDEFYPDRFREIAAWTEQSPSRVGLSLTKTGEIWLHKEGFATFVFRSGAWNVLPSERLRDEGWCSAGIPSDLKRKAASSILDASLAHHGACLAITTSNASQRAVRSSCIHVADQWPADPRSKLIRSQNFKELSRRERVELLSMDGATILNKDGQILATGAIVKVPGGSSGGGRLAATLELARYGCAMKVSQDGPVQLWGRTTGSNVELRMQFG